MKVFLLESDIDRHGAGCRCGYCNSNGKSYGVAVIPVTRKFESEEDIEDYVENQDPIDVIYAESEKSAMDEARKYSDGRGFIILS